MRKTIVTALLATVLVACSTIDCPVQTAVYMNFGVYDDTETATTLVDTMYVNIRQYGGKDTLIYNRGINLESFKLPISYNHPEDTLFFRFIDGSGENAWQRKDTVWVKKQDYPHFESVDCSAIFFHDLTAVRSTHHYIDTIIINQQRVDYGITGQHFHIRFKTVTDL